jgi:hypothetical protein
VIPEGERGLTNTRGDSDEAGILVPNEVSHVCLMSKIDVGESAVMCCGNERWRAPLERMRFQQPV